MLCILWSDPKGLNVYLVSLGICQEIDSDFSEGSTVLLGWSVSATDGAVLECQIFDSKAISSFVELLISEHYLCLDIPSAWYVGSLACFFCAFLNVWK